MTQETAIFAGGCFWCTEAVFQSLAGVETVESGYIGGHVANPTYKQVCGGETGHAEAIRITFDPAVIGYDDLLDVHFATHDPTTLNRQGNDVGTQYRSALFPLDAAQGDAAGQDPGRQVDLQRVGMAVAGGLFLQEQLWLLLPEELQAPAAAKATLRVIQRRAFRAAARGAAA